MDKEIVSRIEKVIDHFEMSVSAFADEIGVQRSSMSHLLNGRNKPSLDFVMKLVDTYPEVGLDWLLKGKGSFPVKDDTVVDLIPQKSDSKIESVNTEATISNKATLGKSTKEPYKIIMFYDDGTFATFNAKKD